MNIRVRLDPSRQPVLILRRIPAALPIAMALLFLGSNAFSQTAQSPNNGRSEVEAFVPLLPVLLALPATTARTWAAQASPSSATTNLSSADDRAAIERAVLADPLINEELRQVAARAPSAPVIPLEIGAIATVENYALANVSGGVGDLPVIEGYYLLKKQSGQWIVVERAGEGPGPSISKSWLLSVLDVPEGVISQLINTLRATGNEVEMDDAVYTDIPMPCITQIDDPNPPTNVRLAPAAVVGSRRKCHRSIAQWC